MEKYLVLLSWDRHDDRNTFSMIEADREPDPISLNNKMGLSIFEFFRSKGYCPDQVMVKFPGTLLIGYDGRVIENWSQPIANQDMPENEETFQLLADTFRVKVIYCYCAAYRGEKPKKLREASPR